MVHRNKLPVAWPQRLSQMFDEVLTESPEGQHYKFQIL